MKKTILFVLTVLLSFTTAMAQNVAINSSGNSPDASAGLDVNFTDKGLLIPRVDIADLSSSSPISSPAVSLVVYNTNTTTGPGYFYWDGGKWVELFDSNNGRFWKLSGNSGTTEGTDFLGTTDNKRLDFRTNNAIRATISSNGNVGIGTTSPTRELDVNGNTRTWAVYGRYANDYMLKDHNNGNVTVNALGGNLYLGYRNSDNILFYTGSSGTGNEKMRLTTAGRLGIGTTNPQAQLQLADIYSAGGKNLLVGDDAFLTDIDVANMLGIYGNQNSDRAGIRLGSDGSYIFGDNGNLGIGTTSPSQKLDVSGNIKFSGALMPNNDPGTAGGFLKSQGAGVPPIWTLPGVTITSVYSVNSTDNLCINSTTFTTYPGCTQTLNLKAGERVVVLGEAGFMVDNNCDGTSDDSYVTVDARIAVNGNDFSNGAWLRTALDNYYYSYLAFNSVTLIGEYTVPSDGSYTFEMQSRKAGGNGNAISGGDNSSSLQATMVIIVYNP